jgi:hypothetical protein
VDKFWGTPLEVPVQLATVEEGFERAAVDDKQLVARLGVMVLYLGV